MLSLQTTNFSSSQLDCLQYHREQSKEPWQVFVPATCSKNLILFQTVLGTHECWILFLDLRVVLQGQELILFYVVHECQLFKRNISPLCDSNLTSRKWDLSRTHCSPFAFAKAGWLAGAGWESRQESIWGIMSSQVSWRASHWPRYGTYLECINLNIFLLRRWKKQQVLNLT